MKHVRMRWLQHDHIFSHRFFSLFTMMTMLICFMFSSGCGDHPKLKEGDDYVKQGKFLEAWQCYCIVKQNDPDNIEIHHRIEQVIEHILNESFGYFHRGEYQKNIDYLLPMHKMSEFVPAEIYCITALSYLYGYPQDQKKIARGLEFLNQALQANQETFPVPALTQELTDWLVAQGFTLQDLQEKGFYLADAQVVATAFFWSNLAQKIIKEEPVPGFPIPNEWKTEHQQSLAHVYRLLSWVTHQVAITSNVTNSLPISPEDTLLRGTGTVEEASLVLTMLCQQIDLPAYLVVLPSPSQPDKNLSSLPTNLITNSLVLVRLPNSFILLDVQSGSPVITKEGKLLEYHQFLSDKQSHPILCNPILNDDLRQAIIYIILPPRSFLPRLKLLTTVATAFGKNPPPFFEIPPYRMGELLKEPLLHNAQVPYPYFQPPIANQCSLRFYSRHFPTFLQTSNTGMGIHTQWPWLQPTRIDQLQHQLSADFTYTILAKEAPSHLSPGLQAFQILHLWEQQKYEEAALLWTSPLENPWQMLLCTRWAQICQQQKNGQAHKFYEQSQRLPQWVIPFYTNTK